MADIEATRELVARSCRILGKLDLTKGATGHVSARVEGTDHILIRARGPGEVGVRFTEPHYVIKVDLAGKKVDGPDDLVPPREVCLHTWVYKTQPQVNCVVHVHPPTVVLFTICNKELLPIIGAYDPSALRVLLDGVPTYPRSVTVSNDRLGEEFAAVMGGKRACMMRAHGITTAGRTIEEATVTAIKLNDLAEMNYRAYLLGNPQPIPAEDLEAFRTMTSESLGASNWPYYCRLVGEE